MTERSTDAAGEPVRASRYARQNRWRTRNPNKVQAHRKLQWAVRRGTVERLACMVCGDPRTDGHHDDYSDPLAVTWLCRRHHKQRHRQAAESEPQQKAKRP